jgi:hypothetical protein
MSIRLFQYIPFLYPKTLQNPLFVMWKEGQGILVTQPTPRAQLNALATTTPLANLKLCLQNNQKIQVSPHL